MASIGIVGAGIGGLAAALTLGRQGHDVTVLERRTGFGELGAGIQVSPNASRILLGLGLEPALTRTASRPPAVAIRSIRSGRALGRVALGRFAAERFGAPYFVIQRSDLHTGLLDAVRRLRNVRLLTGRRIMGARQTEEGAEIEVESLNGAIELARFDLMVGCDGVWSRLRGAIGDKREPAFRGLVAWRATVARELVPEALRGDETGLWLGSRNHVVHYPIGSGKLVNIVAIEPRPDPVEGWSAPGDPAEIARRFRAADPDLRALIALPSEWLTWSLFDLPARRLGQGRIALIGDAAHPVLPFLAQGGALAIEDAAVLADAVAAHPQDLAVAVASYAKARLKRVQKVQSEARRNLRIYHAAGPVALARNLVMGRTTPERMSERYDWLYDWRPPETAVKPKRFGADDGDRTRTGKPEGF